MDPKIFEQIDKGNAEEALRKMAETNNNARLVLADYRNEKKMQEEGLITVDEFETYKKNILERISQLPDELEITLKKQQKASVFLSYSRHDAVMAHQIRNELDSKYNIKVSMDVTDILAGESIKDFIAAQVRQNNAVMILLSKNSLISGWVIFESIMAVFNQELNGKRIIPVCMDNTYLDDDFYIKAIDRFDAEIQSRKKLARDGDDRNAGTLFIHNDIDRLMEARHNLSRVLEKVRATAVLVAHESDFTVSMSKIANTLIVTNA